MAYMNALPTGLALLWNSLRSSRVGDRRPTSSCASRAGFGSNSSLTRASGVHASVDKTPPDTPRSRPVRCDRTILPASILDAPSHTDPFGHKCAALRTAVYDNSVRLPLRVSCALL